MEEKRIEWHDSFGGNNIPILNALFQWLKDEHWSKKRCKLPDVDKWRLSFAPNIQRLSKRIGSHDLAMNKFPCTDLTPLPQGYDCGMFVCMIADFLSIGHLLVFCQDHIEYCRKRIIISIMKSCAM